jgi:hypothetical protein
MQLTVLSISTNSTGLVSFALWPFGLGGVITLLMAGNLECVQVKTDEQRIKRLGTMISKQSQTLPVFVYPW